MPPSLCDKLCCVEAIGEGALREKDFIVEGGPSHKSFLGSASLGHFAWLLGLQHLFGGREQGSWAGQSVDPVALERGRWPCRKAPSSQGPALKHRQALCRVTRGRHGGNGARA